MSASFRHIIRTYCDNHRKLINFRVGKMRLLNATKFYVDTSSFGWLNGENQNKITGTISVLVINSLMALETSNY